MLNIFLINKNALKDKTTGCAKKISQICFDHNLRHVIFETSSIEQLKERLQEYKNRKDAVFYAIGGDGTLQTLVNNIDLENQIVQYIPYGSGNNAYRTFYGNQKFDLEKDILAEEIIEADLGKVNGEYFTGMVGLGIDGKIGNNLAKYKKFPVPGKAKYFLSIMDILKNDASPTKMKITIYSDKLTIMPKTFEKNVTMLSITNGATIGGKSPINPTASAFDGYLDVMLADELSAREVLSLFTKINENGNHLKHPRISTYLFEKMRIEGKTELLHQVDGEIRISNEVEISVCPKILRLKGKR